MLPPFFSPLRKTDLYFSDLIVMWLPPEKMHRPFMVSCVGFTLTVFGLLIWSVHHSNNTGGPYFARDYQPDALLANSLPWAVIYGATSVLGNVGVVTLSQADWCRFAKNGNRIPMIAQIIACPLMIYAACMWNFPPLFFLFCFFGGRDVLLLGGVGEAGMLMLMMVKSRCSGNRRHFCCESNAGFGIMAAISASPSDSEISVRSSRHSTGGGRHPFIPVRGTNC